MKREELVVLSKEFNKWFKDMVKKYNLDKDNTRSFKSLIKGDSPMTYGEIYDEFCKKFPNAEVLDYRPAVKMHIQELSSDIPNAILVWLNDGSKVIYIADVPVLYF
jgi:hypothetical protein